MKPPGHIGDSLDPAGRGVGVPFADEAEHAAEPRLGDFQWAAGSLFTG